MTRLVALYARVSSEQVQQATIDSQLSALRGRATLDGCAVLPGDEYVDNVHSCSTLRRPALERMRDRVAQGAVDTICVHSPRRNAIPPPGRSPSLARPRSRAVYAIDRDERGKIIRAS
jgi:DNA invertase Pin-like site-specific DNA recombinase